MLFLGRKIAIRRLRHLKKGAVLLYFYSRFAKNHCFETKNSDAIEAFRSFSKSYGRL